MYSRLDIFNQWFHAAIRLFSTVISNRPQMTSICGKDKKVADEPQVSAVSLIFIPHFLIVLFVLNNEEKDLKKKTPTCLISPFKCSWISSGSFQVTLYTTFRLYFSFSSLSYLWAVFPKSFSRPPSKKNELPQKCLKLRFSRSDDTRSWQPLWKFLSSSLAIRDDKDQSEINAVHCASAASKTSSS